MRLMLMSVALLIAASVNATEKDPALRPESLVLNETLPLAGPATQRWPLHLSRHGEYLVEAIVEAVGTEPPGPHEARLSMTFTRGKKVLLQRVLTLKLDAANPSSTLLRLRTDREIPLRADVQIDAVIDTAPSGSSDTLRVQIKRIPSLVLGQ
jgi:hypothetical protein